MAEFDDALKTRYSEVKQALLHRFGSTELVEVHEQALAQLRLEKGQNIRELAQEVHRLAKQAYPDIVGPACNRLAVKHLIHAVHDRDTVFYIREKNPGDLTEVCTLYERYVALTMQSDSSSRRSGIRGVNSETRADHAPTAVDTTSLQRQVSDAIERLTTTTSQQLQRLSSAMAQLLPLAKLATSQQSSLSASAAAFQPAVNPSTDQAHAQPSIQTPDADSRANVPRKACPRCGQYGH